ncbi:hypothetical protein B0T21DRAFT_7412 [Apiosordaria backusii]|uniref:Uncharacterized protein n=1 Tax=Apiosordaria backusii TaxID=314023 RepID=A0AA40EXZ9_9PEZI|nr:hypothetical protein B0T21DRAFT_7412 [Apiosordaria backusii]
MEKDYQPHYQGFTFCLVMVFVMMVMMVAVQGVVNIHTCLKNVLGGKQVHDREDGCSISTAWSGSQSVDRAFFFVGPFSTLLVMITTEVLEGRFNLWNAKCGIR